ncbi:MAG: hypothetical protein NTY19_37035 [Planctomycetota bacterium]|nr:hypothetical protein [Planctomycetota bacterium]
MAAEGEQHKIPGPGLGQQGLQIAFNRLTQGLFQAVFLLVVQHDDLIGRECRLLDKHIAQGLGIGAAVVQLAQPAVQAAKGPPEVPLCAGNP